MTFIFCETFGKSEIYLISCNQLTKNNLSNMLLPKTL